MMEISEETELIWNNQIYFFRKYENYDFELNLIDLIRKVLNVFQLAILSKSTSLSYCLFTFIFEKADEINDEEYKINFLNNSLKKYILNNNSILKRILKNSGINKSK